MIWIPNKQQLPGSLSLTYEDHGRERVAIYSVASAPHCLSYESYGLITTHLDVNSYIKCIQQTVHLLQCHFLAVDINLYNTITFSQAFHDANKIKLLEVGLGHRCSCAILVVIFDLGRIILQTEGRHRIYGTIKLSIWH